MSSSPALYAYLTESMLYRLKPMIDSGQFPVLEDLWRLNQAYTHAHLLGQYTSEVFARLK